MWWSHTKGKVHQTQHSTAGRPSRGTLVLSRVWPKIGCRVTEEHQKMIQNSWTPGLFQGCSAGLVKPQHPGRSRACMCQAAFPTEAQQERGPFTTGCVHASESNSRSSDAKPATSHRCSPGRPLHTSCSLSLVHQESVVILSLGLMGQRGEVAREHAVWG